MNISKKKKKQITFFSSILVGLSILSIPSLLLCLGTSKISSKQLNIPINSTLTIHGASTPAQLGYEGQYEWVYTDKVATGTATPTPFFDALLGSNANKFAFIIKQIGYLVYHQYDSYNGGLNFSTIEQGSQVFITYSGVKPPPYQVYLVYNDWAPMDTSLGFYRPRFTITKDSYNITFSYKKTNYIGDDGSFGCIYIADSLFYTSQQADALNIWYRKS